MRSTAPGCLTIKLEVEVCLLLKHAAGDRQSSSKPRTTKTGNDIYILKAKTATQCVILYKLAVLENT